MDYSDPISHTVQFVSFPQILKKFLNWAFAKCGERVKSADRTVQMVTNFGDPICALQAINAIILYFPTVFSNKE